MPLLRFFMFVFQQRMLPARGQSSAFDALNFKPLV
jgi:hypothetical protein